MKVTELVQKINDGIDFTTELQVKKYIPVMEKKKFVAKVISDHIDDIDGYVVVDNISADIHLHVAIMGLYTNIEVVDIFNEMVEQYDVLSMHGVLPYVVQAIGSDYDELVRIFNYEVQNLLNENSVECKLSQIMTKVIKIIDVVSDKMDDVDFTKLLPEGFNSDDMNTLISLFK